MKARQVEIPPRALWPLLDATADGLVVLTRRGKPIAYVLPTAFYDEEDIGYMTDPEFWKMIQKRRESDERIPLEVIEAEMAERERAEATKKTTRKPRIRKKAN